MISKSSRSYRTWVLSEYK